MNFELAKGLEFERVLVIPTQPIKEYLKRGEITDRSRDKLHVAVTRARYSVAFVFDDDSPSVPNRWKPWNCDRS